MYGLKNYKGDRDVTGNTYHRSEDGKLLIQELQNFLHINEGDCSWDTRHGLSRRILYSRNVEAIKSEIKNKILEFYGDRVTEVKDMYVHYDWQTVTFKGTINTIYGDYEIGGAR